MSEAQRLTALLERLRERCAETAEDTIVAQYEGVDEYGDKAAERIRKIELDVAVREYLADGVPGTFNDQHKEPK